MNNRHAAFEEVARFHGHVCPGLAIGYRMTLVALEKLSSLRADDEELVALVENDACGVDAVQYLAGCTFGKGNLIFLDYGKMALTLASRPSEKAVRVRTSRASDEKKKTFSPGDPDARAAWTDWLLCAPVEEILDVLEVPCKAPPYARLLSSVTCSRCGELVAEPRAQVRNSAFCCIPCSREP